MKGIFAALLLFLFALPYGSRAADSPSPAEKIAAALRGVGARIPANLKLAGEPTVSFVHFAGADPWELGVLRVMRVRSSVAKMLAVVENVPGYVGLFKNVTEARGTPVAEEKSQVVYTETKIPIPFVANDRTSVKYRQETKNGRRLTTFSLVTSNHLNALSGASLLIPLNEAECAYWQLSLIKVGYGAARAMPPRMFWAENALGSLQADQAMKLRAENPQLKPEEILSKSEVLARAQIGEVKAAYEKPRDLADLLADFAAPNSAR